MLASIVSPLAADGELPPVVDREMNNENYDWDDNLVRPEEGATGDMFIVSCPDMVFYEDTQKDFIGDLVQPEEGAIGDVFILGAPLYSTCGMVFEMIQNIFALFGDAFCLSRMFV